MEEHQIAQGQPFVHEANEKIRRNPLVKGSVARSEDGPGFPVWLVQKLQDVGKLKSFREPGEVCPALQDGGQSLLGRHEDSVDDMQRDVDGQTGIRVQYLSTTDEPLLEQEGERERKAGNTSSINLVTFNLKP